DTDLFSEFLISNAEGYIIFSFHANESSRLLDTQERVDNTYLPLSKLEQMSPIKDDAGVNWGFYSYRPSQLLVSQNGVILVLLTLILLAILFLLLQRLIVNSLRLEFVAFNQSLVEIDRLTEHL